MKKISSVCLLFCALIPILSFCAAAEEPEFTNTLNMKFVFIQPGEFKMGSPSSELGRCRDEKLHSVTFRSGFYMSATEVTQGQWKQLMGYNPSAFKNLGDRGPVEQVSWNDCQEFVRKLNQKENTDKYRLPTEAEWEYACRAGSSTAFDFGKITDVTCKLVPELDAAAWYCGNAKSSSRATGVKKPNAWGLYDMHGNVQEWCLDRCKWRNSWTGNTNVITDTYVDGVVDPLCTAGERRVFRGGSWNHGARTLRSANRSYYSPKVTRSYIGFRLVREK